jgi:hypothetical protein
MKNQPQVSTNHEHKKCKCDKECNRCKAMKLIDLEKFK